MCDPETRDLQPCPSDGRLLATIYNPSTGGPDYGGAVWRIPGGASATDAGPAAGLGADRPVGRCRLNSDLSRVRRAWCQRLKLKYDELLSKFALNINLRRSGQALESVASLTGLQGKAQCVRWNDASPGVLATVDEGHVKCWSLDPAGGKLECTAKGALGEGRTPAGGAWDPKDPEVGPIRGLTRCPIPSMT